MLDDEETIRERAYAIWEQSGRPEGRSLAHWSQAQAEIRKDKAAPAPNVRKRDKARNGRAIVRGTA